VTCVICKQGETADGRATVPLQRGNCTVIFKDVPADVCQNCGEYYVSEEITQELLRRADTAALNDAELEVQAFAA